MIEIVEQLNDTPLGIRQRSLLGEPFSARGNRLSGMNDPKDPTADAARFVMVVAAPTTGVNCTVRPEFHISGPIEHGSALGKWLPASAIGLHQGTVP